MFKHIILLQVLQVYSLFDPNNDPFIYFTILDTSLFLMIKIYIIIYFGDLSRGTSLNGPVSFTVRIKSK